MFPFDAASCEHRGACGGAAAAGCDLEVVDMCRCCTEAGARATLREGPIRDALPYPAASTGE